MKEKYIITAEELEGFCKSLNKGITAISISIGELGWHLGRIAKILKNDEFYKAICKANKYMQKQEKADAINSQEDLLIIGEQEEYKEEMLDKCEKIGKQIIENAHRVIS